jgi:putative Mg2+ transporter-C (MgtC) family protein
VFQLHEIDTAIAAWAQGFGMPVEHLIRLALAVVCGGLVGLEREIRGRQAGFRTNLLVCVGSAMVMVVSISLATSHWPSQNTYGVQISTDPGRIAYGVMGGIGFLGAGTIIHNKGSIRGLTTAAAMWCVAALGLGAGLGLYVTTILATLIVLTALWLLNYIEAIVPQMKYRSVVIRVDWAPNCVRATIDEVQSHGLRVIDTAIDRRDCPAGKADLTMHVGFTRDKRYRAFERKLIDSHSIELMATRESAQ